MKKLPFQLLRIALGATFALLILLCMAEYNYQLAIEQAKNTQGSDAEIFGVMAYNGFIVNATDPNPPTVFYKVKALFIN